MPTHSILRPTSPGSRRPPDPRTPTETAMTDARFELPSAIVHVEELGMQRREAV